MINFGSYIFIFFWKEGNSNAEQELYAGMSVVMLSVTIKVELAWKHNSKVMVILWGSEIKRDYVTIKIILRVPNESGKGSLLISEWKIILHIRRDCNLESIYTFVAKRWI